MNSKFNLKQENWYDKANIVSRVFITWSSNLFRKGYNNRGIRLEDLCKARESDRSGRLGDLLEQAWQDELDASKRKGIKPSFSKAIIRAFWLEYMLCGLLVGLMFIVLWPLIPYFLALFIEYFSGEKTPESYQNAHVYNAVMNLLTIVTGMMLNHTNLSTGRVGMRIRIACCSLIYRKILKLNHAGINKTDSGQVINLMSNDVNRFDLVTLFLHYVWVVPIMVPIVAYLMWQQIAWATLAALAVIFLQTAIVQAYLSNLQGVLRGKIAKRTDERVKVMSELVNGVQVIKMYAWEKPFEKLVKKLRKFEISFILRASIVKGLQVSLVVFMERLILFVTIVTFVYMGGHIGANITFFLVECLNILQLVCNIYLPIGLGFLAEARVSLRRIEEFLLLDELEPGCCVTNNVTKTEKSKYIELVISELNANWQTNIKMTLRNITLKIEPGEFIGIAGRVGSGKSSLLQVILGELPPSQGSVSLGGARVSYASQEPWLFVASVRENILFGLPYDRTFYKKVVSACALLRDFEKLPAGDATLVSDRGISLSGGQKARIGLARACYRQADIYLLDDPLSAVDTHVGKHLMSECVMGLLRHSTRIVVTHQLHHLKKADKVVILNNGEVETQGSFDDVSHSPLFIELLQEEEPPEHDVDQYQPPQEAYPNGSETSTYIIQDNSMSHEVQQEKTEEVMGTGSVQSTVYSQYFRAGTNSWLVFTTFVAFLLAQVITTGVDFWVTVWMNDLESKQSTEIIYYENKTALRNIPNFNDIIYAEENDTHTILTKDKISTLDDMMSTVITPNFTLVGTRSKITAYQDSYNDAYYIGIWSLAIIGCIVLTITRSLMFFWMFMRNSIKLHNQMFSNILAATMRFFDTNPSGRILNRFSKDMGVIDEFLPRMYLDSIQVFMWMMGTLVMVSIVSPYMIITTAIYGILLYFWANTYLKTSQAIKRVEAVTRSPVFSHVSATMEGLSTVRACGAQNMLRTHFDDKQDIHTAAWYLTITTNATFALWLSLVCCVYVVVVTYAFLLLDDGNTKSGNVGLAISHSLVLVNMVQYGVKQSAEAVSQMISVERVVQFTSLPRENHEGPSPPAGWSQRARVVFKDLSLRYDTDADPVLKKLNVVFESGWKVGVVGRTGAGKSSLISALFRLAPIDGHVFIDDVDTGDIALKELRTKISIIPQEPVLFSASLRYNMDPFDQYGDADIWKALDQVELKSHVISLSSPVLSGGSNFSAGQRQLLCLARAALGRNKLLVLDEATANVDPNTDALIQKSIRKHFADCTVITVAHRLHTVADSDRVIVMEAGEIVECGHPHELLQQEKGHFTNMVKQLVPAAEQSLRKLAAAAYLEHTTYTEDSTQL